jgi:GT2 family glycosyltransferase
MKVSIITPVYNQAKFIQETIDSVLGQDYPDIEYIVIDDGSKDESPKVISRYTDRLTHIRHDNVGESRTVNKGYRMSTGDIVGVVNSDDPLFTRDAVSRIVACFKANPNASAVYPDWVSIDESGTVLEEQRLPQYTIESMLTEFSVSLGPGMFIKRNVLSALGYRNESVRYTGDLDLSFRLALEGSLAHLPHIVATHRVHPAAASSAATGKRMAGELVQMAVRALDSGRLPPELRGRRIEILALANWVAASHCGSDEEARAKFLRKARLLRLLVLPYRVKTKVTRTLRAE